MLPIDSNVLISSVSGWMESNLTTPTYFISDPGLNHLHIAIISVSAVFAILASITLFSIWQRRKRKRNFHSSSVRSAGISSLVPSDQVALNDLIDPTSSTFNQAQ